MNGLATIVESVFVHHINSIVANKSFVRNVKPNWNYLKPKKEYMKLKENIGNLRKRSFKNNAHACS